MPSDVGWSLLLLQRMESAKKPGLDRSVAASLSLGEIGPCCSKPMLLKSDRRWRTAAAGYHQPFAVAIASSITASAGQAVAALAS